jgi:hypothetical protein
LPDHVDIDPRGELGSAGYHGRLFWDADPNASFDWVWWRVQTCPCLDGVDRNLAGDKSAIVLERSRETSGWDCNRSKILSGALDEKEIKTVGGWGCVYLQVLEGLCNAWFGN